MTAETAFDGLVDELDRACAHPRVAARLALVGMTVVLRVAGTEQACTLVLQSPKPEVLDGAKPGADVEVELPQDAVGGFWDKPLAMQIFNGEVTASGPMRRFLAVVPVLRAVARGNRDMRAEQPDLPDR